MEFIEKAVRLDEAVKVFCIIEHVLREQISTQVHVANALYEKLYRNGVKDHVYLENCVKPSHYNDNDGRWLNHTDGDIFGTTIHLAYFIQNSADYMQLVQFKSKKLENYTHFKEGFKQLLFIEVEK